MKLLVLWLLLQQGVPTVGDTVWLARTVPLHPGDLVRAPQWQPDDPVEVLGHARLRYWGADSAEVAWPVSVWRPGSHRITVPGPIVVSPQGAEDSLAATTFTVTVASVLPPHRPDSTLAPQPPARTVVQPYRTPVPLILLLLGGIVLVAPLHWWWRRRGRAVAGERPAPAPAPDPEELARWVENGERRAAATVAAARLRGALIGRLAGARAGMNTAGLLEAVAGAPEGWSREALAQVLRALDRARFDPDARAADIQALLRESERLRTEVLEQAP